MLAINIQLESLFFSASSYSHPLIVAKVVSVLVVSRIPPTIVTTLIYLSSTSMRGIQVILSLSVYLYVFTAVFYSFESRFQSKSFNTSISILKRRTYLYIGIRYLYFLYVVCSASNYHDLPLLIFYKLSLLIKC